MLRPRQTPVQCSFEVYSSWSYP
jgi:hypothetical protein